MTVKFVYGPVYGTALHHCSLKTVQFLQCVSGNKYIHDKGCLYLLVRVPRSHATITSQISIKLLWLYICCAIPYSCNTVSYYWRLLKKKNGVSFVGLSRVTWFVSEESDRQKELIKDTLRHTITRVCNLIPSIAIIQMESYRSYNEIEFRVLLWKCCSGYHFFQELLEILICFHIFMTVLERTYLFKTYIHLFPVNGRAAQHTQHVTELASLRLAQHAASVCVLVSGVPVFCSRNLVDQAVSIISDISFWFRKTMPVFISPLIRRKCLNSGYLSFT